MGFEAVYLYLLCMVIVYTQPVAMHFYCQTGLLLGYRNNQSLMWFMMGDNGDNRARVSPAIIVHGGAWSLPDRLVEASVRGVEEAAGRGWDVAGVKSVRHPVSLARRVMEETDHVMIIGEGAMRLARELGIEEASQEELVTESARRMWERYVKYRRTVSELYNRDTVGAVALDAKGNIAAATSTGGITGKKAGRVGDVPIVGSGAYADNLVGGASSTGHGESIMKVTLARLVLSHAGEGLGPVEAAELALRYMLERVEGRGGVIVITSEGEVGHFFTTRRMPWASVVEGRLESGV
jgi:isoaspartyl peptidase/L-asparaginase-like protein (Ntn-hydrolase superfamily)